MSRQAELYTEAFDEIERLIRRNGANGTITKAAMGEALSMCWLLRPQTESDRPYFGLMNGDRIVLAGAPDETDYIWLQRDIDTGLQLMLSINATNGGFTQFVRMYPTESAESFAVRVVLMSREDGIPFSDCDYLIIRDSRNIDSNTIRYSRGNCVVGFDDGWYVYGAPTTTLDRWHELGIRAKQRLIPVPTDHIFGV